MEDQKSLKDRAEEIMSTVNRELQQAAETSPEALNEVDTRVGKLTETLFGIISDVDIDAAAERVDEFKKRYPDASSPELAQKLIREKIQRTGAVGAVTSGAGLIPGIGTAAALTLGVAADIGATFKLQSELVLEIARVYDYPLTEEEKQRIVMLITGLSAGTSALARRAGQAATLKIGEKFAEKAIIKALPVIGVAASAGTNVLSTYIIGQRADAYFRLGPEAVGSWGDSLRTISGVDERKVTAWLADSGKATGVVVARAGRAAGQNVKSGAQIAGATAEKGVRAYIRWLVTFWSAVFRFFRTILGYVGAVLTFIPRKVRGSKGAAHRE